MTVALVWLFVMLIGGRLRLRPPPRRPLASTAGEVGVAPARHRQLRALRPVGGLTLRRSGEPKPEQVAAWCDGLARALRGGSTLASAIGDVEPPASCVSVVEAIRLALRRGASLREACTVGPCPADLELALMVIRACAQHGGPAAEPLSRTAATLRGRAADLAERRTSSAQAGMSAIVMTVLPLCMLGLLLVTSRSVRLFVVTPLGLGVMFIGAACNVMGWRWMRRMIDGGHR